MINTSIQLSRVLEERDQILPRADIGLDECDVGYFRRRWVNVALDDKSAEVGEMLGCR